MRAYGTSTKLSSDLIADGIIDSLSAIRREANRSRAARSLALGFFTTARAKFLLLA